MKKSMNVQIVLTVVPIVVLLFFFWVGGMFDMISQTFGLIGIITVFALILLIVFFAIKLTRLAIQPKTITNGISATATVIRCDMGGIMMITGGIDKSFILKMEVNVANSDGENWSAKMVEHIPAVQADLFQPGYTFSVLYHPDNRNKVKLDKSQ